MLIINDFFTRRKEAVSNQMELVLKSSENNSKIITATRFMNQKSMQDDELKDNIFVYHPAIYPFAVIKNLISTKGMVHLFQEEPSLFKKTLLNLTKRPLYISLYRRPTIEECKHLKKYKYLKGIFVELQQHKEILINNGFDKSKIFITPTPSKFNRESNNKKYIPSEINILFASWNMAEGKPLYDRGLVYLLELLKNNLNLSLSVVLRDNNTSQFEEMINEYGLNNRVKLLDVFDDLELEQIFKDADYVSFPAQKRIVKDVPNSLIDGLCKGKPVIISNVLDFSNVVEKNKIGFVVNDNNGNLNLNLNEEEYKKLSENAFNYSKIHTNNNYVNKIKYGYKSTKFNIEKEAIK